MDSAIEGRFIVATSKNVLIRALAMADERLGKRRLRALRLAPDAHPLVRRGFETDGDLAPDAPTATPARRRSDYVASSSSVL